MFCTCGEPSDLLAAGSNPLWQVRTLGFVLAVVLINAAIHASGQVTYYDDIGAAYEWAVKLPVAAVSLDFLGVPGSAYGNETAALIEKCGSLVPQKCAPVLRLTSHFTPPCA